MDDPSLKRIDSEKHWLHLGHRVNTGGDVEPVVRRVGHGLLQEGMVYKGEARPRVKVGCQPPAGAAVRGAGAF